MRARVYSFYLHFDSFRFSLLIFVCVFGVCLCAYLPFILFAHHHFILFHFGCCCSLPKSLFALVLLVFICALCFSALCFVVCVCVSLPLCLFFAMALPLS